MVDIVKRFIAGAVCPRCGELDRLQIYTVAQDSFRECVQCDYLEKQIDEQGQSELETRVTREIVSKVESKEEISVIKFFPKPPK